MIRVAIIDDSATMRALITAALRRDPNIDVVGTAGSISEARDLIRSSNPDVVTLDLEMPDMHGLDFLERLMRLRPVPVIVVSGHRSVEVAAEAVRMGAVDYYTKSGNGCFLDEDGGRLAGMVRHAARGTAAPLQRAGMIAIGASTGGVDALHTVLAGFPADCPPTVIVQHTSDRYAAGLAQQLDAAHKPRVVMAGPDEPLRRGTVMLAGSNETHLLIAGAGGALRTRLRQAPLENGHRPSIDMLFHSVASVVPGAAVGIILTGMGDDGARGLLAMHRAGCPTIAQDAATSTVYGMPRVAAEIGAAGHVLPLGRIAAQARLACAA